MQCRHCQTPLAHPFLDLGFAPPSNAYLKPADLQRPELYYPLKLFVCDQCWLVQTMDFASAASLFDADYAYFSSISKSWLDHAARYCVQMQARLALSVQSMVVELASNDGYLLKNFVAQHIPCLGIEPTASTAAAAEALGIPVLRQFFGQSLATELAAQGKRADLIIGNNVYAHVPDINDFTQGMATLLKPEGTITLEFPHLLRLIEQRQFDTAYHEHFSYLSLTAVQQVFAAAGLVIYDVEELSTHGGSLRVYGAHRSASHAARPAVAALQAIEEAFGLRQLATYAGFQAQAESVKNGLLQFLLQAKRDGKTVAAYGAAAKGNTLLNFAGIKADLLSLVCDAAPSKQHKYMPGSHLKILPPEALTECKPDYVLILPWNIAPEVMVQHDYIGAWGGRFVTAVPTLKVWP
jgi:SAM-dependent methyltransferase